MKNLKFIKTYTIEEFKEQNNGQPIKIYRNPENGKFSFRCGKTKGAVSQHNIEEVKSNPAVSLVESLDTGEQFFLVHKKGEKNHSLIE